MKNRLVPQRDVCDPKIEAARARNGRETNSAEDAFGATLSLRSAPQPV